MSCISLCFRGCWQRNFVPQISNKTSEKVMAKIWYKYMRYSHSVEREFITYITGWFVARQWSLLSMLDVLQSNANYTYNLWTVHINVLWDQKDQQLTHKCSSWSLSASTSPFLMAGHDSLLWGSNVGFWSRLLIASILFPAVYFFCMCSAICCICSGFTNINVLCKRNNQWYEVGMELSEWSILVLKARCWWQSSINKTACKFFRVPIEPTRAHILMPNKKLCLSPVCGYFCKTSLDIECPNILSNGQSLWCTFSSVKWLLVMKF